MSGPDVVDTEAPSPPWRHRDERGRHFFQRLSDRTPLRTKLITAVLALVIVALAVISVASVYMLRGNLTTQHDPTLDSVFSTIVDQRVPRSTATPGLRSANAGPTRWRLQGQAGSQLSLGARVSSFPGSGGTFAPGSLPQPADERQLGQLHATPGDPHGPGAVRPRHLAGHGRDGRPSRTRTTGKHGVAGTLVVAVDLGNVNALTDAPGAVRPGRGRLRS